MTSIINPHSYASAIDRVAATLSKSGQSDRQIAISAHNFVRDCIFFGWTSQFDLASAEYTIEAGRGHCVPQAFLFVSLLRTIGIRSRLHYVEIGKDVLWKTVPDKVFAVLPAALNHAYSEVALEGRWVKLDSYVLDPSYFFSARSALIESGREIGYGLHKKAVIHWDGKQDSFSQFADPAMCLRDLGCSDTPDTFRQRVGPCSLASATKVLLTGPRLRELNKRVDDLRSESVFTESIFRAYRSGDTSLEDHAA